MRKWSLVFLLSLLILAACGRNRDGAPSETGPEAFFSANLLRNGVYETTAVKNPALPKWQFAAGEWVFTAPAVVENTVYFGSYDGNLFAADTATGAETWRTAVGTPGEPIISSPAVSGGVVYVGGMDGNLYAINRADGQELWRFATQGSITASPAIANGLAYIGSEDGNLYAINVNDGQEAWHVETGSPISFEAAIADNVVYFGNGAGVLTAVKAINGEKIWEFSVPNTSFTAGPALGDGVAYYPVTTEMLTGELLAVDLTSHQLRWRFPMTSEAYSSPAIWNGLVYLTNLDGKLYAVEENTGVERWNFPTSGSVFSSPAIADGIVYFGSWDQNLYA
ncbi:MAG: PQQ-binding-like beta-propeller repeat protein, partial [Candidatus Promineifilaceae bacterium]